MEDDIDDTLTTTSVMNKDRLFSPQEEKDNVHQMSQKTVLYNTATANWKGRNIRQEVIQTKADEMGVQFEFRTETAVDLVLLFLYGAIHSVSAWMMRARLPMKATHTLAKSQMMICSGPRGMIIKWLAC